MFGLACHYDPRQHRILESGILAWCKRQVSDPYLKERLFTYYHRLEHTFVIALWLNQPKRWFVDVLNMGYSLGNFNRHLAEGLRRRLLAPLSTSDIRRQLRNAESDHLHKLQDQGNALSDRLYGVHH